MTDILRGVPAIAEFIGLSTGPVYRMIEAGIIPAGHLILGNKATLLIGSKRRITEALDRIAFGEADKAAQLAPVEAPHRRVGR